MKSGKRQRRSYSCGPCKVLKIKCDLQLPCSSCEKFKRQDKCYQSPPQPPTESELLVIKERKERMSKRKKAINHNIVPSLNPISRQIQLATLMSDLAINANFQFITDSPNHFVIQPTINKVVNYIPPEGQMFPTITSYVGSNTINPTMSIDHLLSDPIAEDNAFHQIEDYFQKKKLKFSFKDKDWHTLAIYYFPNGENVCEEDLRLESSNPSVISVEDLNFLKMTFPSAEHVCRLFVGHFKSFKEDLLGILDYPTLLKLTLKFTEIFQNAEYNHTLTINAFQHRLLAIVLTILASGLILYLNLELSKTHSNNDISTKWVLLSKKFKEKFKKTDTIFDIIYLMLWYFAIDNYYYLKNMLVENHFEYNSLLSNLLFNKKYMKNIIDRRLDYTKLEGEKLTEFKIIAKLWLKLRVIEINVIYFQYKSSLLQSNNLLKYSIIPSDSMLNFLYGEKFYNVEDDIMRSMYELAKEYFNMFDSVGELSGSKIEIIESYLTVYANVFKTVGVDVRLFEQEIENGKVPEINYTTLLFYYRSQLFLLVNVKWLTLVNMETGYFPSLRYALYLTTILTITNHYMYLDELIDKASNGENCLLKELGKNFSYYPLEFLFYSVVIVQLFLICLKSHISNSKEFNESRLVNLQKFYELVDLKYHKFYTKFKKDFNETEIRHLPIYNNLMTILEGLNSMQKTITNNTFFKAENLLKAIKTKLQSLDLLVDLYFGCQSTIMNYLRKLVYIFEFINSKTKNDIVLITSDMNFTEDLVFKFQHSFTPLTIDTDTVNGYLKTVVDPIIKSRESSV